MSELLSSKVVVVEEEPRVRGIPSLSTSVAAAIGIAERGPIDTPVLCTSFDEYQTKLGGFTPDSDLALAAMGFFENGGAQLWCVRTVHHTSIDDSTTATATRASGFLTQSTVAAAARVVGTVAAPFALKDGTRIAVTVNGGSEVAAVFKGSSATATAAGPGPYALVDGQTLDVEIDSRPAQSIVFTKADFVAIGAATAKEVTAALTAKLAGASASLNDGIPAITSDTAGTGSRVAIVGGTANAILGFSAAPVVGKGNVPNLATVTVDEARAVVEAAISGVQVSAAPGGFLDVHTTLTGGAARIQIGKATSPLFGFDTVEQSGSASSTASILRVEGKDPGAYANRIDAEVRAPISGEAGAFDLAVIEDGTYREFFRSVRLDRASERYVENVVNDARTGSALIRVTDLKVVGASLTPQVLSLAGGNDGLVGLVDSDFIGSEAGRTGVHALDRIQDLSILLVPGRATPAVQNAMLRYCEIDRGGMMFSVLDPPANASATEIVTYVESTAALLNFSEFGAIYWPRVAVLNPARSVFGRDDRIIVPPSGIIAGVYARTDAAKPGGVYEPPAGIDVGRMFGVLGFETDEVLDEKKRDIVYPKRINPLTTGPGLPRYIDGSRTLKGNGNFPCVAERRGVSSIERALRAGLQFARHKNNNEELRATVRRTIDTFLLNEMNNGAFASKEPAKAFFIDLSQNTPAVVFAGKLIVRIGLATNKPAEFIILSISQDTRSIEAALAAAGG